MVTDSTTLRNALHDQLAALRVSYAGQQSDVLDAAQTAAKDVDRLVAALNKWVLSPSGAGQAQALEQAVQAVDASENALLSRMGKTQRIMRPGGAFRRGTAGRGRVPAARRR